MSSLLDSLTDQNDPQIDESKNYLDELVGEGKRYKDAEALAKSKLHGDITIANRERELKEIRDELLKVRAAQQAGMSQQDFLDQMKSILQSTSREQTNTANDDNKAPTLDLNQLKTEFRSLVSEEMRNTTARERAENNYNSVVSKLREQFGNSADTVLMKRLDELDLSIDDANALARKSPKAFFNTLGLDQPKQESFEAPFQSQQRSGFKPGGTVRDRSYYEKMRKEEPAKYWDPKTQNQMIKDGEAMGPERFFGIR